MSLSICSPIVVVGIQSNGLLSHPAIVNRVWSDGSHGPAGCVGMVNATVFPDQGAICCVSSMYVFRDAETAAAWSASHDSSICGYVPAK